MLRAKCIQERTRPSRPCARTHVRLHGVNKSACPGILTCPTLPHPVQVAADMLESYSIVRVEAPGQAPGVAVFMVRSKLEGRGAAGAAAAGGTAGGAATKTEAAGGSSSSRSSGGGGKAETQDSSSSSGNDKEASPGTADAEAAVTRKACKVRSTPVAAHSSLLQRCVLVPATLPDPSSTSPPSSPPLSIVLSHCEMHTRHTTTHPPRHFNDRTSPPLRILCVTSRHSWQSHCGSLPSSISQPASACCCTPPLAQLLNMHYNHVLFCMCVPARLPAVLLVLCPIL